jgi:hypothetical protein
MVKYRVTKRKWGFILIHIPRSNSNECLPLSLSLSLSFFLCVSLSTGDESSALYVLDKDLLLNIQFNDCSLDYIFGHFLHVVSGDSMSLLLHLLFHPFYPRGCTTDRPFSSNNISCTLFNVKANKVYLIKKRLYNIHICKRYTIIHIISLLTKKDYFSFFVTINNAKRNNLKQTSSQTWRHVKDKLSKLLFLGQSFFSSSFLISESYFIIFFQRVEPMYAHTNKVWRCSFCYFLFNLASCQAFTIFDRWTLASCCISLINGEVRYLSMCL